MYKITYAQKAKETEVHIDILSTYGHYNDK